MALLWAVSRPILEVAREQRPALLDLTQDVTLERRVLPQELVAPTLVLVLPAPASHERRDEWQRLEGPDVGIPFEARSLVPEQPIELCDVVGSKPAPENELLWRCDRRDRVDLQEPESSDRFENARRRSVEKLGMDGDPARLVR